MIWTVEIAARPVIAVSAADLKRANAIVDEERFREELARLRGQIGEEKISLRQATHEEAQKWNWGVAEAVEQGDLTDSDDAIRKGFAVPLVPVRD